MQQEHQLFLKFKIILVKNKTSSNTQNPINQNKTA